MARISHETEVLIVGGGPAGLAAAIALRQRGIDCLVVEALAPGIDKACGEGLMPATLESLARLGVRLHEADGHSFRGIRFVNSRHQVDAEFRNGAGIGVRRPRLHTMLGERAVEAGARVLWSSRVELGAEEPAEVPASRRAWREALVNGEAVRFRWLVGADGHASAVRRWAGLDATGKHSLRYGFRIHYRVPPWSDFVEAHWGRSGQLYVTPVAADCVCVVFLARDRSRNWARALEDFAAVARRLEGAEIASRQRGGISAMCRLRRVAGESVALIGDASGSVDSIAGEGLAMSFRQALALSDSIAHGTLRDYEGAHRLIARRPRAMAALMLMLDRRPALERRAMRVLANDQGLFCELLRAHTGEANLISTLLRRGPQFGWGLLTG